MVQSHDLAAWARALGFSLQDLELNRRGQLAPGQIGGLGLELYQVWFFPIFGLAVTILTFVALKPWWRWPLCIAMMGLVGLLSIQPITTLRERLHPHVVFVEGKPEFAGGYRHSYVMKIGRIRFSVPQRFRPEPPIISPDQRYRVYYLRDTRRLLTLEPVDEAAENGHRAAPP